MEHRYEGATGKYNPKCPKCKEKYDLERRMGLITGKLKWIKDTGLKPYGKRKSLMYSLWECPECNEEFEYVFNKAMKYERCPKCNRALITERAKQDKIMNRVKHGLVHHPLYDRLRIVKDRCYKRTDIRYKNYWSKGIKVCEEWHDPVVFIEWAEKNGWEKGKHLHRVDNNDDYKPSNCKYIPASLHASLHNRKLTDKDISKVENYINNNNSTYFTACKEEDIDFNRLVDMLTEDSEYEFIAKIK